MTRPKTDATKPKTAKKSSAGTGLKSKKKLSPYNKFMKTELAKVKKNNPGLPHKDAFKKAAQNWATSAENPKGPNAANK